MNFLLGLLLLCFFQTRAFSLSHLKEQNLLIQTGWELFKSDRNFSSDGESVLLRTNGTPSSLSQHAFLVSADYGVTDVWAFLFRTGVLSAQIDPEGASQDLSTGLGFSDTGLGFRWLGRKARPAIGVEGLLLFPPYSVSDLGPEGLAIGDGVSNFLLRVPLSTRFKRVRFEISPGIKFRFGRFSHQLLIDSSLQLQLKRFFFGVFQEGVFSFTKENLLTSSTINSEPGSGGSFSRLSLGPEVLQLGVRSGFRFSDKFELAALFSQAVWGSSSADGFKIGLQLSTHIDFFTPDERERIKEVPLNSD